MPVLDIFGIKPTATKPQRNTTIRQYIIGL